MTALKLKETEPSYTSCIFGDKDTSKKAYDDKEKTVKEEMQVYDGENVLPKMAFVTFRSIAAAQLILKEFEEDDDFGCCWSSK
jgi:hypothetical protein